MKRDLIISLVILVSIVSICISSVLFPSAVYDNWIWKYYWGPVVADALGREVEYHGVVAHEGYTLVSEITYGIIALICLYYIYKLLRRLDISIDWNLCISMLPFFLYGSMSRVLEDAGYFKIPLSYLFISPLIYVHIAVTAVGSILLGWFVEKNEKSYFLVIYGLVATFIYTVFWLLCKDLVIHPLNPLVFALVTAVIILPFMIRKRINTLNMPLIVGLTASVMSVFAISTTLSESAARFDVFIVCLSFPALITLSAFLTGKFVKRLNIFSQPLNLSMIFGQALDGFATYISIYDPFGMGIPPYGEKHPVSSLFMSVSGGILYPVIKIGLIILIILIFEDVLKSDKRYREIINLLKISVFILGFSPGLRDLLRVTLSV